MITSIVTKDFLRREWSPYWGVTLPDLGTCELVKVESQTKDMPLSISFYDIFFKYRAVIDVVYSKESKAMFADTEEYFDEVEVEDALDVEVEVEEVESSLEDYRTEEQLELDFITLEYTE